MKPQRPRAILQKDRTPADYRTLSNEDLYRLLCFTLPHMVFVEVTDDVRETVVAMLVVSAA